MPELQRYEYKGQGTRPNNPAPNAYDTPEPYVPASKELIEAVNVSIFLQRPLLLEGEAGCGKSRLAYAVAYELGLPLYVWHVRSNSRAEDGLYRFDAVRRLYDVQAARDSAHINKRRDPAVLANYVQPGALGRAFQEEASPGVVLIDEIDKADLDFPNDLLNIIEDSWFEVRETGERIVAKHKPILFVTSNREKGNLPLPFLRRCVYYFMQFPNTEEELLKIVRRHYLQGYDRKLQPELTTAAVKRFRGVRERNDLHKKPGTSELLDWIAALHFFDKKPYPASSLKDDKSALPYAYLLFKLRADLPAQGQ